MVQSTAKQKDVKRNRGATTSSCRQSHPRSNSVEAERLAPTSTSGNTNSPPERELAGEPTPEGRNRMVVLVQNRPEFQNMSTMSAKTTPPVFRSNGVDKDISSDMRKLQVLQEPKGKQKTEVMQRGPHPLGTRTRERR